MVLVHDATDAVAPSFGQDPLGALLLLTESR